jgi:hypothetical protein
MNATGLQADVVWQSEQISVDEIWPGGFIDDNTVPYCEWQPTQVLLVPSKMPPEWQRSQDAFW